MRVSSVAGISIAVVLFIPMLIVTGNLLGIIPDETGQVLLARKTTCESLAAKVTSLALRQDLAAMRRTLRDVVESDPDILSAAVRDSDGQLLAVQGDHERNWTPPEGDFSTPTHAQVPIYQGTSRWGTVEVRFTPLSRQGLEGLWSGS